MEARDSVSPTSHQAHRGYDNTMPVGSVLGEGTTGECRAMEISLVDCSDDSLIEIFKRTNASTVGCIARSCRTMAQLVASADTLWQHVTLMRWPLMPAQPEGTWRAAHRERSLLPHRGHCPLMDESTSIARGLEPTVDADEQCDRLAVLLVATLCSPGCTVMSHSSGRVWAAGLASTLARRDGAPLRTLREWGERVAASLNAFYDGVEVEGAQPMDALDLRRQLRAILLRVYRCASALKLLVDEVVKVRDIGETGSTSGEVSQGSDVQIAACDGEQRRLWSEAALHEIVDEVVSALQSLELEGFDTAVPPSCRPNAPKSHHWWHAKTPIHYAQRC